MGFYSINLDALAEYVGKTVEELKNFRYNELEQMVARMQHEKIMLQNSINEKDKEYAELILKYWKPRKLLGNWFKDNEIVYSCARSGVEKGDICKEKVVPVGRKCPYEPSEYLRRSIESVPQYDAQGREYRDMARKEMDVYRVTNSYQGIHHGKPILFLLYERYPELKAFEFSAYEFDGGSEGYTIYPKNKIYVEFNAMMYGDVDAIIFHNREYCKWYNNGRYSPEECEKAFRTTDAKRMFDAIVSIGRTERMMGRSILIEDGGKRYTLDGMEETATNDDGTVMFMEDPYKATYRKNRRCRILWKGDYTVGQLMREFLDMTDFGRVNLRICRLGDHLTEQSIDVPAAEFGKVPQEWLDTAAYSVFGWRTQYACSSGSTVNLIIRTGE